MKTMTPYLVLTCLGLLTVLNASILSQKRFKPPKDERVRIAVIGSGIGGSSFVHYFNKLNNSFGFVVDIYDRNDYVGGRTKSINIDGEIVEVGASIAIKDNQYIYNLVDELSLTHQFIKKQNENGKTAIWDGQHKQFLFVSYDSNSWIYLPHTLWHFGAKKLLDLFILSRSFVANLNKIYQYQNTSQIANDAKEFYEIMDVFELSQTHCIQYLYQQLYGINVSDDELNDKLLNKISKYPILNELIQGITRVNYNQNFYNMHALVCMTSISAIGGGGVEAIWNVKEGNNKISERIIENAIHSNKNKDNEINVYLSRTITSITKLSYNATYKYKIAYSYNSKAYNRYYDIIVIAAPLSTINSKFIGFDQEFYVNLDVAVHIKYEIVYVTLVNGELNQNYFEQHSKSMSSEDFHKINDLLVGPDYDGIFSSISRKKVLKNNTNLYKIFSTKSLKHDGQHPLNEIFSSYHRDNVIEQHWNAYPKYSSPAIFPNIIMDDGIYYVNSVEAGASAMEILVINGRNIALLVNKYIMSSDEYIKLPPESIKSEL